MVKPGGTGRPRLAISARLAPLPPRRSRRPALPSALPSPKVKTHLLALMASVAGALPTAFGAAAFAAVFGAGLAAGLGAPFGAVLEASLGAAFANGLRAAAAGLARDATDGFDFAEAF